MKILIATGIYPPDIGGPATMLGALAKSLEENGFEIRILTYSDIVSKDGEKIFRIGRGHYLKYFLKILRLSKWAEIVYVTDTYSVGYFAYLIKKFTGKKYIVRFAGDSAWETAFNRGLTKDDILNFQEKTYGRFIKKLKKRRTKILQSADAVIAVSDFMKKLAGKLGVSSEKTRTIYNAIDFFDSIPQYREPTSPTLVFSGRLTPWKGLQMLLELVSSLKQKYPNIVFEIVGDGPEMDNLKSLSRQLNIEKNVNFRGRISESESHLVFANSTIFVLNTNYEGLSHAVLNALNVGLPVIITPAGGNPEVIQDGYNGLLAPYNDKEAWFKAITRLLDDRSLREKFSINGKQTLEKFKWSELVEKTIDVFNSI